MIKIATVIGCLIGFSSFSQCDIQGEVYQIGTGNNFCAGINTNIFNYYDAEQTYDNWCWAACVQMVLNYQGLNISDQCEIVFRAHGNCNNQPGSCSAVVDGANGWAYGDEIIQAWSSDFSTSDDLIDALSCKYPVIIGLDMPGQDVGHAYVLTAVSYHEDQDGNKVPDSVKLRDPWPYNPDIYETTWNDFVSRINCIVFVTY